MKALIGGILGLSTLDYPGRPCAVIFMCKCPFRCPFCHNFEMLRPEDGACKEHEAKSVITAVLKNRTVLDAIVFTGGEPLEQDEALREMIGYAKEEGFLVKLDTNGFYPKRLEKVIPWVDFVAIDIKNALQPKKYADSCGLKEESIPNVLQNVVESIAIVKAAGVELELRTTVVPGLVTADDINDICSRLKPAKYVLQQFRPDKTLDPKYSTVRMTPQEELEDLARIAKDSGAKEVWIRGETVFKA